MREALPSNTKMLTFRSPEHADSIVHMYPLQCALKNPDVGAVLDTGAQRSAAKYPAEILEHTHTSHAMQGAFGRPTTMKGILMGCSTVDIQGIPLTLVIPDESVSDPLLSDSFVSAGRLMEAEFGVIFRLRKDARTDGFHPNKYPLNGGLYSHLSALHVLLSSSIVTTYGVCLCLSYGFERKSYSSLTPTTLSRLYVASTQRCHSPASQRQPHHCVQKWINVNSSLCAHVKSKLRFSMSQEVIAMRVTPIGTSKQLGCKFAT
jgi:hypothetical protein